MYVYMYILFYVKIVLLPDVVRLLLAKKRLDTICVAGERDSAGPLRS